MFAKYSWNVLDEGGFRMLVSAAPSYSMASQKPGKTVDEMPKKYNKANTARNSLAYNYIALRAHYAYMKQRIYRKMCVTILIFWHFIYSTISVIKKKTIQKYFRVLKLVAVKYPVFPVQNSHKIFLMGIPCVSH